MPQVSPLNSASTIGSGGFAYLISFPAAFLIDPSSPPVSVEFEFENRKIVVREPIRLGDRCWRPIPLLNVRNALTLFGDDLDPLPLQISAIPQIGTHNDPPLSLYSGRGGEYEPGLPPDTLIVAVHGADHNYSHGKLTAKIIEPMLLWLRILTKQWWLGRGTPAQTGNTHFGFDFQATGNTGPIFTPLCRQTAAYKNALLITKDIWVKAFELAIKETALPWNTVLIYDTEYHRSNRDYLAASVLACGWAEVERDLTLKLKGIKLSALQVSSTDLLKQLSHGFEKIFGRNLHKEHPTDFEFLRSLWRARGEVAHGKPFNWEFNGYTELVEYQEFGTHLDNISKWFDEIRET